MTYRALVRPIPVPFRVATLLIFVVVTVRAQTSQHVVDDGGAIGAVIKARELWTKGQYEAAINYMGAAIQRKPKLSGLYEERARMLMNTSQWRLALQDLNDAIRLRPDWVTFSLRAWVYECMGDLKSSLSDYNQILKVNPTESMALDGRASILASYPDPSVRNGRQAINDATRACAITQWKKAQFVDTLAAAYAETGDYAAAVQYENKAIALQSDRDTSAMRKRLALYEDHKPYRRSANKSSVSSSSR